MKILLIGKNGQVGWELQRSLSTLGDVVAVDYFDKELCGDLTDLEGIAQTVRTVRPDVVVNAAADLAGVLPGVLRDGDLLLMMGAGDIGAAAQQIAREGVQGGQA